MEPDEAEEGVTAESYGTLDLSSAPTTCWMVRIPPALHKLWESAPEGTELGDFIFTRGGKNANGKVLKPSFEVSVSSHLVNDRVDSRGGPPHAKKPAKAAPVVPLNYSLQAITKKIPTLHPFMRNPKNGSCQIMGTVSRTANLQVERGDMYRAQLQARLQEHNVKKKSFVKSAETTDSIVKRGGNITTTKKNSFGNSVLQFGKRKNEAAQEMTATAAANQKKQRQFTPNQPLRSVIFELFGIQQLWTIKDLKAAAAAGGCEAATSKKAEAEIREMLKNEIGIYHRAGDNKQKWELRKEFQQQSSPSKHEG